MSDILLHLHLVSDSTGETVSNVARASLSQFDGVRIKEHVWNLVRTDRQLDIVLVGLRKNPGIVFNTLLDQNLQKRLQDSCRSLQVPCLPILEPLISALADYFAVESRREPGRQHVLNAEYFDRIDAVEFAFAHDDGQNTRTLHQADVVLVGVSRTSKTPTCLYLANRGVKAANIPLVPGVPLPPEVEQISSVLVVGLTKHPSKLLEIRRSRVRFWQQKGLSNYADPNIVEDELKQAERLFRRHGWSMIDVTNRSIEETAAEVMMMLAERGSVDRPNARSGL